MKIHFIGIGGIGTSALARYYKEQGHQVQGTDLEDSEIIKRLQKEGFKVFVGPQEGKNITKDIDLIIRSAAVSDDNREYLKAKKEGLNIKKYAECLGEISKNYYTICVAGSHGKTTTTALLTLILVKAGIDPTVIIGTNLKELNNTNFRKGSSFAPQGFKKPVLLLEADEWQASFLNYSPDAIALTNIDKEHLDYYKNLSHIRKTFREFIFKLKKEGILVFNPNDKNISQINLNNLDKSIYRIPITRDAEIENTIRKYINIPGKHNILNALTAYSLSRKLGIEDSIIFNAIKLYRGAWRRFQTEEFKNHNIVLVNDYAHHPSEIKATIRATKEKYPNKKIWVIFQPHQRQRTHYLFNDLVQSFDEADFLILTKIYDVKGRESSKFKVKTSDIKDSMEKRWNKLKFDKKIIEIDRIREIAKYIKARLRKNTAIIVMGAGDIYKAFNQIKLLLKENQGK